MTKPKHGDTGPDERRQHGALVLDETIAAGVMRARDPTPDALDFYHARRLLGDGRDNQRRYDAGARLRGLWDDIGLEPRVVSRYSDMVSDGAVKDAWTPRNDESLKAFRKAMTAVGPIASNEVAEVCCWGRAVGRDRMEILRRGMEQLAQHWRY